MTKFDGFQNQGQHSSLKPKPLKGPSSKTADFPIDSDVHLFSNESEHDLKMSTLKSSTILRTTELISAVGQIWDSANQALACLQPKPTVHPSNVCQKQDQSCHLIGSDDFQVLDPIDITYLHVDLTSSRYVPCMVKQSLDLLRPIRDTSYEPFDEQFIQNLFPHLHVGSIGYDEYSNERSHQSISSVRHNEVSKETSLKNMRIPYHLLDCYTWMNRIPLFTESRVSDSWVSKKKIDASEDSYSVCHHHSRNEVGQSSNFETKSLELCSDTPNNKNLPSATGVCEPNRHKSEEDDLSDNKLRLSEKLDDGVKIQSKSCLSVTNQHHGLIAKQEHAVSGALAGIFVSLCLHPLDTVKTVVQSCRVDAMSIHRAWQSIVSERGLTGLYRGITSNITTSAPISAIYTFTYESVKGFLLPSFSKEYHSIAHCTAGACASIATSFVFTPSERIKQQMQINSQYKNCWNAVYRIIEKGGLPSLYTGWGAVLCRNIPHSVIKFYTYESLKEMFAPSEKPTSQPSTLLTLLCGGLAGSSAALFSTPFDVVKTRLQTQMPGSVRRYDSILGGLKDICREEGVKGLYRGLIPRLVMYMSQGALFFTSYELFKSLMSLDIPRHKPEILQNQLDLDDDPLLS